MPRIGDRWTGAGSLVLVALLAMGGIVRNGWVQDEPALLTLNPTVHEWRGVVSGFTGPFWPAPATGGLYRPATRSLHTLEWKLGGGAPLLFRLVDLAL